MLDLSQSQHLIEIPDVSRATDLESMVLSGCTRLVEVPSSIRYLNKLSFLNLNNCQNLRNFPSGLHLRCLESLYLSNCLNVTKFPEISGNIEKLYLTRTAIEEVPSSIGCLSRLRYFYVDECKRLKRLPSSICKLKLLQRFSLNGCLKLERFPEILETMEGLESLFLSGTSIEELPSSIDHLVGLKKLCLDNSEKLKNLPSSFKKLNSLEVLSLNKCSNITKFPEIPGNVTRLYLSETAIEQIPSSIECYSKLEVLYLENCATLGSLPRYIFESKSLHVVKVSGFAKLEVIQEQLGIVKVVNIHPLYGAAETGNMRSEFRWSSHGSLSKILSLNDLVSLRKNIGNMKSLVELSVSGCSVFEELPDNLENLKSLTTLRLSYCNLIEFSSLTIISSLRELNLSGNNFEVVPASINQLLKLERLNLSYCKMLQSLAELPPCLKYLDAHDCTSLEAVSGAFPISYERETFIFTNCKNLDQKSILAKTQLHIQQLYHHQVSSFCICFPGSGIPEWFSCQNLGSSVTTPSPSYLNDHKFVGFAVCIVVELDYLRNNSNVECRFNFKINGDVHRYFSCCIYPWDESPWDECPRFIGSDHVFLVYDSDLYHDWDDGHEALFEFSVHNFGHPVDSPMVKKCGVHLLYGQVPHPPSESESDAEECNPLMIQPSSSYGPMVEDGTTTKRPRDDYDEAEPSGNIRSDEEEETHPKRLK